MTGPGLPKKSQGNEQVQKNADGQSRQIQYWRPDAHAYVFGIHRLMVRGFFWRDQTKNNLFVLLFF